MATQVIYDLLKYSRSYPSEDPARFSTQPTSYDTEWQHFSNAKLQLCLDDASTQGYFRSAKVTILWVPVGSSLQPMQQETAVFLEDLDLRSFSPVSTALKKAQPQSPPLKVVYRDSVVGFRYLHPRVIPAGALPAYRRFQICFKDPSLTSQFVDSIRRFCPCKASLLSTSAPSQPTAVMARTTAATGMSTPANNKYTAIEPFPVATYEHSSRGLNLNTSVLVTNQNQPYSMQPPTLFPPKVQPMQHNDQSGLPLCGNTTYPFNTIATSHMSSSLLISHTDAPSLPSTSIVACSPQRSDNVVERQDPNYLTRTTCSTAMLSAGINDPNDPSTSSKHSTQGSITSSVHNRAETAPTINMTLSNNQNGKVPNHNLNETSIVSSQSLVPPDCLRDPFTIKELCALSMDQLEHLVGEVIREPEFHALLEKLDGMWKVKGLITRTSKECKP